METKFLNEIVLDSNIIKFIETYFNEKKVLGYVYCISNEIFKYYGTNIYKIGKAVNIDNRISDYNMYYLENPIIEYESNMIQYCGIAECMVFNRLRKYKIKKDREFVKCELDIIRENINDVCFLLNEYDKDKKNEVSIKKILVDIPQLFVTIIYEKMEINKIFGIIQGNKIKNNIECANRFDKILDMNNKREIMAHIKKNRIICKNDVCDLNILFDLSNYIRDINFDDSNKEIPNDPNQMNILNLWIKNFGIINNIPNSENILGYDISSYNIITDHGKCIMNGSVVHKWLNITKSDFKKVLTESYINNVDYKIERYSFNKKHGGQNNEKIMVTPNTFKKICMKTKRKEGHIIIKHLQEIESKAQKYVNYMENKPNCLFMKN